MALRDITREAVEAAIAEFDRVGREAFLDRYGFDQARQYVLAQNGESYDSKAIVGAAHGYLPGETPLKARQFSGGEATVGRLLRRLGFSVQVGEELTVAQLEELLARLKVYGPADSPALYQPITLLWAFGRARRGDERLAPWLETEQQVKVLFQQYGRGSEGDRVLYPVAALHNAGLWEISAQAGAVPTAHGSSVPQRWFDDQQPDSGLVSPVHNLVRESPEALAAAIGVLTRKYFVGADPEPLLGRLGLAEPAVTSPLELSFQDQASEYHRLCARADASWRERDRCRPIPASTVPERARAARDAVIVRSSGRCENPGCAGDVRDVTDKGAPLLEVDHIHDLALGGDDNPAQMIALCPNCHSIKTRGRTREQLRAVLLATALSRHERLASPGLTGNRPGQHP